MDYLSGRRLAGFMARHSVGSLTPEMVAVTPLLSLQRDFVTCRAYDRFMRSHPYRAFQYFLLAGPSPHEGLYPTIAALARKKPPTTAAGYWAPLDDRTYCSSMDDPCHPANVSWFSAFFYAQAHGCRLPWAREYDDTVRGVQTYVTSKPWHYGTFKREWNRRSSHLLRKLPVDDPRCDVQARGLRNVTGNLWHWMMDDAVDSTGVARRVLRTAFLPHRKENPTVIIRHAAPQRNSYPLISFRCAITTAN